VAPRLVALVTTLFLAACGGAQSGGPEEATTEQEIVSEPLPISSEEPAASEETTTEGAEEAGTEEPPPPPCTLDATSPEAVRQLSRFSRWLRDQSVGRRVAVDDLSAICGDQEGYLVLDVHLRGPAGGLDSLGRALPLYYPSSTWTVIEYERLPGDGIPLRVTVDVRLPTGAEPRPRCTWDLAIPCP